MDEKPPHNQNRDTLLAFMLVLILGGSFVFFLNLVSFGIFSYVIAAIIAMVAVGFLHYVLWGYAYSQEVAGEREEEETRRRMEAEE